VAVLVLEGLHNRIEVLERYIVVVETVVVVVVVERCIVDLGGLERYIVGAVELEHFAVVIHIETEELAHCIVEAESVVVVVVVERCIVDAVELERYIVGAGTLGHSVVVGIHIEIEVVGLVVGIRLGEPN
jgi:hypothetical protein